MKEKELWMEKLKEKLDNYSEPIPTSGWEQLEKELMPSVEKKIYPYRRWTVAAAVLLVLVSSLSLYFLGTPVADDIRHTQAPVFASLPDALPQVSQPDETVKSIEQLLRPATKNRLAKNESINSDVKITAGQQTVSDVDVFATTDVFDDSAQEQTTTVEDVKSIEEHAFVKSNKDAIEKKQAVEQPLKNKVRRRSGRDKLHIPTARAYSQKENWSVGFSYGNSGGASTQVGSGMSDYMSRVNMAVISNGFMPIPSDQTLVFEEGVPYLLRSSKVIDINHHQPISFGLNLRKYLGRGFSLETGLTYTLLSSDAKLSDSDLKTEQKLHYLGIPLRANWNFVDKKLFTLYVSGGGMVEKCVYGKLGSEKETVKPLQFSVSGAVGAQINATKRVGIYVEPGVAYFFNDGSEVQTIRKENPFNFNIQAGIRLTY